MPVEARAYFRTHYLPVLSHGLQVYLNLLNSAHQPVGAREIQLFAKNVVEQVQADYTRPAHWPTIVRFMRKTNRPDVNKALQTHRTDLWVSLSPEERREGEIIMKKYAIKELVNQDK
jgi:hypothetical protein